MTPKQKAAKEFKRKFKIDHPSAKLTLHKRFHLVSYPTGLKEFVAIFCADQAGYRGKIYRLCVPINGEKWYTV